MRAEVLRRSLVVGSAVVVVAGAITVFGMLRVIGPPADDDSTWVELALASGFLSLPLVGAGILWAVPRQPVARLLLAMGLLTTVSQLCMVWAFYDLRTRPGSLIGGTAAAWVASWMLVPGLGLGPFVVAMFPNGRIRARWLRLWAVLAASGLLLVTAAQAVAPEAIDGGPRGVQPIENPLGVSAAGPLVSALTGVGVLCLLSFFAAAVVEIGLRFRRASGDERQQLRWLGAAAAVLPVAAVSSAALSWLGVPGAGGIFSVGQVVGLFGVSVAVAVGVLRYRLYSLDLFLSKSLLYAALTAFVAIGYALVVGVLGLVFTRLGGTAASLVATGAVALAFQPARQQLQRAAERLVHGSRSEPYAALARLGDRLESAVGTADVPQLLVEAVTRELRLPFAALEIDGATVAVSGARTEGGLQEMVLSHQGELLGTLVVGHPGRQLGATELRLLLDLSRQAGAALHATRLAAELQRSRALLVAGREEERRRIRRDLHDGVGPALAGLALQAGALRQELDGSAPGAGARRLEQGLEAALAEVRRAVQGLRPPALDELGLLAALTELSETFGRSGLDVRLELPEALPTLSAAAEVAILRIAGEALSNVARHAGARHCVVRLLVGDAVVLEVADDGQGLSSPMRSGVGLRSMRERAEEIGGEFSVTGPPGRGATIRASCPLGP